jgi:16S rRNA U516 pseudouridylate synthase RsuA-like enzyme
MQGLENSGAHADGVRSVGNVGRLDAQTSGALLVTDDGLLHHLLTRPGSGVWKVYEARVRGLLLTVGVLNDSRVELVDPLGAVSVRFLAPCLWTQGLDAG